MRLQEIARNMSLASVLILAPGCEISSKQNSIPIPTIPDSTSALARTERAYPVNERERSIAMARDFILAHFQNDRGIILSLLHSRSRKDYEHSSQQEQNRYWEPMRMFLPCKNYAFENIKNTSYKSGGVDSIVLIFELDRPCPVENFGRKAMGKTLEVVLRKDVRNDAPYYSEYRPTDKIFIFEEQR